MDTAFRNRNRQYSLLGTVFLCTLVFYSPTPANSPAQTTAADLPKLLQQLIDKDPAIRGAAAAAFDNFRDKSVEPALIAGLKQDADTPSAATVLIRVLGQFNDANSVAAIAEVLPTPSGHAAAARLLQMDPLGVQVVADATASQDEATRSAVVDSFLDAPEVALKVLPATLKRSNSPYQRGAIVSLLAGCAAQNPWYEDPPRSAFVESFLPAATDPDPGVRIAVAQAIGELADAEKFNDEGMGHPDFGLARTLPVLKSYALDPEPQLRSAALDALGSMSSAVAISIIKLHLNDADSSVKQHAEKALSNASAAFAVNAASSSDALGNSEPSPKQAGSSPKSAKTVEARKLAEIKNYADESAVPILIPFLQDPSSLVRAAAADKLGQLDYRSTAMNGADREQNLSEVPALIEALKDSHSLVRAASAEALGAIGDESAVNPLIALLKDPKPKVVIAAAGAIKAMVEGAGISQDALSPEDHQAAGGALVELLSSPDPAIRYAAINALISVGTLENMKHLVSHLRDEDNKMRNFAARALARAFYPNPNAPRSAELEDLEKTAAPALVLMLSFQETRSSALAALASIPSTPPQAAAPLMDSLKYNVWIHADGMARPEIQDHFDGFQGPTDIDTAIDLLGRTGSPDATPLLVKFLNIINPDAGKHACAALAKLHDPSAIGPLLAVVQSQEPGLQPDAATALGSFQDPRIVPALIQSLESQNYSLRAAAAGALAHFHDPRVLPALVHSLTDENSDVRAKVAEALGEVGDKSAIEPLSRYAATNYAAVRALANLKFPESVPALVGIMQDKKVPLPSRGEAVAGLAKLGYPDAIPPLIQMLQQEVASNPNSNLAVQCIESLGAFDDPRIIEGLRKLTGQRTMPSQVAGEVLEKLGKPQATQQ